MCFYGCCSKRKESGDVATGEQTNGLWSIWPLSVCTPHSWPGHLISVASFGGLNKKLASWLCWMLATFMNLIHRKLMQLIQEDISWWRRVIIGSAFYGHQEICARSWGCYSSKSASSIYHLAGSTKSEWKNAFQHLNINIARIANAVQCDNLLSGNNYCHEFRFSNVRIVISVSNVTSLQDCQKFSNNCQTLQKKIKKLKTKKLSKCWSVHVSSSLWSNVSKVTGLFGLPFFCQVV